MAYRSSVLVLALVGSSIVTPPREAEAGLISSWFGSYLTGRVADGIWDYVTGKPDIRRLDSRLRRVEAVLARREGQAYGEQVRRLRQSLTPSTSPREYVTLVDQCERRLAAIESRVTNLESTVAALQAQIDGLSRRLGAPSTEFPMVPPAPAAIETTRVRVPRYFVVLRYRGRGTVGCR